MRRPSDTTLPSLAPLPPAVSEADVLRASVKAASGAARILHAFGDSFGATAPALKGFRAFADAFNKSLREWESAEVQCFLECICFTPQPKKGRGAAPPPNDGDFVLDCYVAERFYERSGFGRATYRMLRTMAEDNGLVVTERRQSQPAAPSGRRGAPRTKNGAATPKQKQNAPSTTSVPLLIKLTKKGWDVVGAKAPRCSPSGQVPRDALYHVLRGQELPSPCSLASASSLSSGCRSSDEADIQVHHGDSIDYLARRSQELRLDEEPSRDSLTQRASCDSLFSENSSFFALAMGDSVCAPKLGSAESLESLSNRTMELAPLPVTGSPEAPAHTLRDLSLYASPAKAPLDLNASKPVQQPRSAPHKQPASACYDFKARSWVDVATQEDLRHGRGPVDYRAEVLKTVDRAASFVQTDGPVNHVGSTAFSEFESRWEVPATRAP
uniref:Uncharacterized protein n=1 Tax=Pinguiococcus pyrenoidosus TaxID=172671 RepID=A0A7R9UG47_9STRA|mmetsp:Transcript_8849/g.33417  ORF Transcript_8849/g.33417 Transcript_8849/m.33417 type:complete len:441 (+) Transcript_8849:119-1441(+)